MGNGQGGDGLQYTIAAITNILCREGMAGGPRTPACLNPVEMVVGNGTVIVITVLNPI